MRVYEVSIACHGRQYSEGKKIGWKDGVSALWTILRFALQLDVGRGDEEYTLWRVETLRRYTPTSGPDAALRRPPRARGGLGDRVRSCHDAPRLRRDGALPSARGGVTPGGEEMRAGTAWGGASGGSRTYPAKQKIACPETPKRLQVNALEELSTTEGTKPMTKRLSRGTAPLGVAVLVSALALAASPAHADGNLQNVNHIILMMQENRSFDNYFGALPYVPNSPYHSAQRHRACATTDNTCVDGLSCKVPSAGGLVCRNFNPGNTGHRVTAFHDPRYCTGPDLDHSWIGSHEEGNFRRPNNMLKSSRNLGFVRVNAQSDPPAQVTDHDTMGFYTDVDLPFYYGLAETFAISDRYFAAIIGQTFPNRAYFGAGTSFGHLTTSEIVVAGGYKPINGTIYDRLDAAGVSWTDYFSDIPYSQIFAISSGHTKPVSMFASDAANGLLPQVAFVDPSAFVTQTINGRTYETDEHPPNDIRAGEYFVSTIISALRTSSSWNDSVLFLTYDEHGGFYDHVKPPPAAQGGALTPDGIAPGQCADASAPPASEMPGGGANCNHSKTIDAPGLCPAFTPTGPYPTNCATFNQLGFRLPLIAVSPFAKPHYVSHTVGSHTSLLALLEKRFSLPSLAARDANANDLEDMFDFDTSPSASAAVGTAPLPAEPGDPNCPFNGSPSGAFLDTLPPRF